MFCHLQVDRWADQHCIGDQGEPGQPERDIEGGEQCNTKSPFISSSIWLFLSGCSNQAEWFDEQIPHDQQLGEQDQLPQEEGHHHLGGCDWVVPCLHALVHIWLACGKWSSVIVISYMYHPVWWGNVFSTKYSHNCKLLIWGTVFPMCFYHSNLPHNKIETELLT